MTTVEVATEADQAAPAAPRPMPVRLPSWLAAVATVVAGTALLLAFPNYHLWWCAPIGVALLALAVHRRGFWGGAGLGALTGLTLYATLLSWTQIVGGVAPWLLLAGLQATFVALL